MKKILLIDLESPNGHISLNKTLLANLSRLSNVEVACIFRQDYLSTEVNYLGFKLYTLPNWLYSKRDLGAFLNRFLMLIRLYYLKFFFDLKHYDIVFFSCYDEIVYFFSFIKRKVYLLNNINVSGLNFKLKVFFYKLVSKRNIQVVFEDYIKEYLLKTIKIKNVVVLKHGLPEKIQLNENAISFPNIDLDMLDIVYNKKFLFVPSATSTDTIFLEELLNSIKFNTFLNSNDIYIIIKGKGLTSRLNNILIIDKYLADEEYKFIFQKSFGIIISYPSDFAYRVSNVFFECVINNKICFLSNINALKIYKPFITRPNFFNSIQELIIGVQKELTLNSNDIYYLNTNYFSVDIKCLENYISCQN